MSRKNGGDKLSVYLNNKNLLVVGPKIIFDRKYGSNTFTFMIDPSNKRIERQFRGFDKHFRKVIADKLSKQSKEFQLYICVHQEPLKGQKGCFCSGSWIFKRIISSIKKCNIL